MLKKGWTTSSTSINYSTLNSEDKLKKLVYSVKKSRNMHF